MERKQLTAFSFGGGQDSFSILDKLVKIPEYKKKYAPGDLLIIQSDTGDEYPETYEAVDQARDICNNAGFHFKLITKEDGYHIPSWPDLIGHMRKYQNLIMNSGPKSCTANLKIGPFYKYLNRWISDHYGYPESRKNAMKQFASEHGPIKIILGIAEKEEKRVSTEEDIARYILRDKWQGAIERVYPMIDDGIDRAGAQEIIRKAGYGKIYPSNCMRCPYQSSGEILWLYKHYPKQWEEWVELEKSKLERDKTREPRLKKNLEKKANNKKIANNGVFGKILLPEKLKEAFEKFGHLTDEELDHHKMTHGHCIKTKY